MAKKTEPRERVRNLPLRFASIQDARVHIEANDLKVVEHSSHTRGARIQVVDSKGRPRTITIERSKGGNQT